MKNFNRAVAMCMTILLLGVTFSFAQTPEEIKAKAKERMDAMDTNKDGKISKEEYLANCSQRFDALDTNKDGFLSKEELQEKAATFKEKAAGFKGKFRNQSQ